MCDVRVPLVALSFAVAMFFGCQSQLEDNSRPVEEVGVQPQVIPESITKHREDADDELILVDLQPECEADAPIADGAAPSQALRKIEVLIKSREFETEGPEKALRVSFDDLDLLKVLNMDPVTLDAVKKFPPWLNGLDGKLIRIRGVMIPTYETTGLKQFAIERGVRLCKFAVPYKVYELIAVNLKPGTACDYIHLRAFDVIGKFRIDMQAEDGKPYSLYWIEDAQVVQ